MTIDFEPAFTPLGVPVLTSFLSRQFMYVVDMEGMLFQIDTEADDPDLWCWREVVQL
jgi:hypothetical protein